MTERNRIHIFLVVSGTIMNHDVHVVAAIVVAAPVVPQLEGHKSQTVGGRVDLRLSPSLLKVQPRVRYSMSNECAGIIT